MCLLASVAAEHRSFRHDIHIPIVVETLLYESASRSVLTACDLIVCNQSGARVDLFLTHPDDVEGWLATEDWFPELWDRPTADERMTLLRQIYGKYCHLDPPTRTLHFVNPVTCPIGAHDLPAAKPAHALSYRPHDGSFKVDTEYLDSASCYRGANRMRQYPNGTGGPRPFSAFRFNLGPNARVFFRLTTVIRHDAYNRLVDHPGGRATFDVVGPEQVLGRLDRDVPNDAQVARPFQEFSAQLREGHVEPQHYHIIIAQAGPADPGQRYNRLVGLRGTSPTIRELYVLDDNARNRALWFDAVSADFRMVLRYLDRPGTDLTRQHFCGRHM
jgi:hypothetical protein